MERNDLLSVSLGFRSRGIVWSNLINTQAYNTHRRVEKYGFVKPKEEFKSLNLLPTTHFTP